MMFQYKCLNPISPCGTSLFTEEYKQVEELQKADAVLVRSAAMHDMQDVPNLLAVARAGAGVNNIPIADYSEKGIRKMIPHWSSSKYHTATIENVCNDIKHHIECGGEGIFVYNSNANTKNKRYYNDTYILLISDSNKFFFDINRKKTYKIIDSSEVTENV